MNTTINLKLIVRKLTQCDFIDHTFSFLQLNVKKCYCTLFELRGLINIIVSDLD